MKKTKTTLLFLLTCTIGFTQSDIQVGTNHQLNIQRQNSHADAFILHNAIYSSADDNLKWKTVDPNFGSRGIRFSYSSGRGIYFYADEANPTSTTTEFTPTTRFFIGNNGKVGVGTTAPTELFQVGGTSDRGLSVRLGERATFGLTSTNAETVIGNNAYVSGTDVRTYFQDGASAITMKWNNGIHFYVTDPTNVSPLGTTINTTSFEKMRVTYSGVYADQVTVELQSSWPDYVFNEGYLLPELKKVESFIKTNKHLPGLPSAAEVSEKGINLGQMDASLLEKIEQLTLYLIDQNKKLAEVVSENEKLKVRLTNLESRTSDK